MKALLKFRSKITTEETYPYSFWIEFKLECHNVETLFEEAHEFEEKIINGNIVDTITECQGIIKVREAKGYELTELAKMGLENI